MGLISANFRLRLRAKWLKYIKRASYRPARPIFFIHIPKTAGTSFRDILFRVIDPDAVFPNFENLAENQGKYPLLSELPGALLQVKRDIRLLTGHYPFAVGELMPKPIQYCVFFREPVARTISNLVHFQRNEPDLKSLSLLEIFEHHQQHLQNLQTRFLCESSMEDLEVFYRPDLLSEKHLEQAKTNLEKCTFIGITEKFSDSMKIAEKLLGIKLGDQLKRNVAPAIPGDKDPALIAHITPFLKLDLELYQYALHLFSKQQSLTRH